MAACIGDMHQRIAGEALDGDGTVIIGPHRIGEGMDVGFGVDVSCRGCGTIGLEPHIGAHIHHTRLGMDGQSQYLIGVERAIGHGEVVQLLQAVG